MKREFDCCDNCGTLLSPDKASYSASVYRRGVDGPKAPQIDLCGHCAGALKVATLYGFYPKPPPIQESEASS